MLPTVRQVLLTSVLASAEPEILTGAHQLDRPVRWLHPAEVFDIAHLLRGDEVVLTTGSFLPDDAVGLTAYAQSLAAAGVAGLFLELGRKWEEVPDALVDACARAEFVLVVLHREIRFAEVTEQVGGLILEAQIEDLRASDHIHEIFTSLDLEASGPEDILAAVVRSAGVPVVLETTRHQVIGYDAVGRDATDTLKDWARRSRTAVLSGRTGYDRRSGWLMTVVGSRGDDWGRLVLMTDRVPSRRDYVLIERAAGALVLHQMRARARDSIERNTHTALLADLRSGKLSPELILRCEAAQFPVESRHFFAVGIRGKFAAEGSKRWTLPDLALQLTSAGRALGLSMLVGLDTDHVIGLISTSPEVQVEAVLTKLTSELRKVGDFTGACGEQVESVESTFRTLLDARHILAATNDEDARSWVTLADVHLRGLIHLLREDERLSLYVRRELGALLAYDAKHGTSLVGVLSVVLQTPDGKSASAKRLLLSRPVLYERLAKIEAILGVDLNDPLIRTSLHVAVLARCSFEEASGRRPQLNIPQGAG